MKTTSVAPRDLGDAELRVWRDLIGSDPGFWSPFLSPRFAQIIGEHRPNSRIALLEDGSRLVGFLPYERDAERVGLPISLLMNDAQALIAPRDLEWDLPGLVRDLGARVWRFDHLLPDQPVFSEFVETWHASPTINLAGGLDAYHAEVRQQSSSVLKKTGGQRRRVGREVGPVTFEWHSTDPGLLDTLIRWKTLQYQRTHVHDLFDTPWPGAALHDFHESTDPECAGVLSVLSAGDQPIALHLGITRGPVLHRWFGAYDPDFAKFSPGLILLHEMTAAASEHGIVLFDFGRGDQEYKRRVANDRYFVAEGRVPARGRAYRGAILARHPGWLVRRVRSLRQPRVVTQAQHP